MKNYSNVEVLILDKITQKSNVQILKPDLINLAHEIGLEEANDKMDKFTIAFLIAEKIGYDELAKKAKIGVSSYELQEKFNITNDDIKRMAKDGFLTVTGSERFRLYGKDLEAPLYSPYDFFKTEQEIKDWMTAHPKRKVMRKETTLYINQRGIKFVRINGKNMSCVKVIDPADDFVHMEYWFRKMPFFESPYMSWANLDLCGGWPANDELALLYLKEGTKPAATINFEIQSKSLSKGKAHLDDLLHRYGINVEEKTFGYALLSKDDKPYEGLYNWIFGIYPENKKLSDYYDIDEILEAYWKQGIRSIDRDDLAFLMDLPMSDHFDMPCEMFFCPITTEDVIVKGMLFGYPIESTAALITKGE